LSSFLKLWVCNPSFKGVEVLEGFKAIARKLVTFNLKLSHQECVGGGGGK
jgi:hypothetical protein